MAGDGKSFELIAGHMVLDLVNTLDFRFRDSGPDELLGSYSDLLRFVAQSGLMSDKQIRKLKLATGRDADGAGVLERVKDLREALAKVGYAFVDGNQVPTGSLAVLERYFKEASAMRGLAAEGSRLNWTWRKKSELAAPLWRLAQEAADLFLSERVGLLRSCGSDTCRWLFLDTSKNHTRRWCDMKVCGNRMKARRFQARLASE